MEVVPDGQLLARVRDALVSRYGRLRDAFNVLNDGLSRGTDFASCPCCGALQEPQWDDPSDRRMTCKKCTETNSGWKKAGPGAVPRDNHLDPGEVVRGLRRVGVSEADALAVSRALDKNMDGTVSHREFMALLDADVEPTPACSAPKEAKEGFKEGLETVGHSARGSGVSSEETSPGGKPAAFGDFSMAMQEMQAILKSKGSTVGNRRLTDAAREALQDRGKRPSFFKRHRKSMWDKVKTMDYMLHTAGNDLTIEATETGMEIQNIWNGSRGRVTELLRQATRVDALMESLGHGLEYLPERFDEWNVMRECQCETTPEMIEADSKVGASPCETPGADSAETPSRLVPGSTPPEVLAALAELQRLSDNLRAKGLRTHETGHIADALCKHVSDVRRITPAQWGRPHSERQHAAAGDLASADALREQAAKEAVRKSDLRPQSAPPVRRLTTQRRKDLPHRDSLWGWEHRFVARAGIREMRNSDKPDSEESILLLRCDIAQEAVSATCAKFSAYADGLDTLTKLVKVHRTEQKDLTNHVDRSIKYREHLIRRCERDVGKIKEVVERHESENSDRAERAERRRQAALERLRANTAELERCFSRVDQLVAERTKEVQMRVEAAHVDAKREGQMTLFREYSRRHTQRLQAFVDRCRAYLDTYRQQRSLFAVVVDQFDRDLRKKEDKLGALVTECHSQHLQHLSAFRGRIEDCMAAQQGKLKTISELDQRLQVDAAFCDETSDDVRGVAVAGDLAFLSKARCCAEETLSVSVQRIVDIRRQGEWSVDALEAVGVEAPVDTEVLLRPPDTIPNVEPATRSPPLAPSRIEAMQKGEGQATPLLIADSAHGTRAAPAWQGDLDTDEQGGDLAGPVGPPLRAAREARGNGSRQEPAEKPDT